MSESEQERVRTGAVRAAWAASKPNRHNYAAVVSELNASKLVGEGRVFERGAHVPVTQMGYFKPPGDAFLTEMRSKDRRSAKECEYVNGVGVWIETGLAAMELAKERDGSVDDLARRLALADRASKAALEVVSMSAKFFRDITENGVEKARQIAYLVEQGHDAVHSESYRTARKALTGRSRSRQQSSLLKPAFKKREARRKAARIALPSQSDGAPSCFVC